jgi:outer membrane receptor protein involved in Fe transport
MSLTTWAALFALLTLGASAPAEDGSESDKEPADSGLEEKVEVRAATPGSGDVAAFTTTLDADEIAERGEDLASVLRRVPGARVNDYGGLGRYSTVTLRASTAEQVTILVDGIPQNRALGGPVDLSFIPATQISHLTSVDLLTGELGTARLATGWTIPAGERGSVRIGAEALSSEGNFLYLDAGNEYVPDDTAIRTRENNDVAQVAFLVQGVVDDAGGGELRLATRVQNRERGVPGVDNYPAKETRLEESFHDLNLSWSRGGIGPLRGVDVLADVFDQTVDYRDLEGELGVGVQDQTTRLTGGGVAGILSSSAGRNRMTFRVELRRDRASVTNRALAIADRGGADRTLLAVTAEDVVTVGHVTFAPALRWEYLRDEFSGAGDGTLEPAADDRSDGQGSGKLGVAWAVSPEATIRGSVGRFHRNPSLLELFGDRGAVVGNPALLPESGWSAEIGGSYRRSRTGIPWSIEVVAFGREVEDLIALRLNSQATLAPRNLRSARVVGVEGSIAFRLPKGFNLEATGTLRRSEDRSGGDGDGESLLYQPDRLAYVGAGWEWKRLRTRWDLTYVGENRFGNLPGQWQWLPARVIHDLMVAWDAPAGWTVGVDVRNVFDRDTRDVARYPLPGRAVFLHLGWRTGSEAGGTP